MKTRITESLRIALDHRPVVDPTRCACACASDPACCALLEVEYATPGHSPGRDIERDLDDPKRKAAAWAATRGGTLPASDSPQWPAPRRPAHGRGQAQ
ncbi:MAG TPA: acetone carboxylase subunit gamma [Gammaproteobacteria bacterium]|nr:acetone carboxylase subunit gamma [Gammaproteobacteria bacterium]